MRKLLIAALFIAATCHAQMDDYPWIGLADANSWMTRGLVAYYSFQDGTPVANGYGTDATNYNGASESWAAGYAGQGAAFDGTNDVIRGKFPSLGGLSEISICCWVKQSSAATAIDVPRIVSTVGSGKGAMLIFTYVPDCKIFLYVSTQTNTYRGEITTGALASNAWHFVTATYSNNDARIYVDAVERATTTNSAGTGTTLADTTIICMGDETYGNRAFMGSVDEVRFYNRALSLDEHQNMFQYYQWLNPIGR